MELAYAHPIRRLIAYWIDITLLYSSLLAVQFGFIALTNNAVANWLVARQNGFLTFGWFFLSISLPMWLYFTLTESTPYQATVGKRLMGLKVTDLEGQRLSLPAALWRTICKLGFFEIGHLSFLFPTPMFDEPNPSFRIGFAIVITLMILYYALTFITPRRQSLHDLVVKTLVVRSK